MLRTIRLYGELGKKYGRTHKLAVNSPAEAMRALCANFPDLKRDLLASEARGLVYKCEVDGDLIDETELHHPMSRVFTITPVVRGAGAVFKIIVGVVLMVVGALTGQVWLAMLGASLALGGIAQMLAPTPKMPDGVERKDNQYFDGPVNSSAQGEPVPIGYGRLIVGSKVISAAITVESPAPATPIFPGLGFL